MSLVESWARTRDVQVTEPTLSLYTTHVDDVASSKLISFADDTRLHNQISETIDCDSIQRDLNSVYKWASENNMFFNARKFHYLPLSASKASNKSNIYINPSMDIIPQSTDVPDLGIIMSKDCSFDSHISSLSRKC